MPIVYDLVRKADDATLQTWDAIPGRIDIADDKVSIFTDGALYDGEDYKVVAREVAAPLPEPEPAPIPPSTGDLIAYANAKQWMVASGGVTIAFADGPTITFATDPISMTLISGKYARLQAPNPPTSFNWQTGPTTFAPLTAAQFGAAATAIADFVQHAFDALPAVLAGIESGAFATIADIDAAAWPTAEVTI